LKIKFQDTKTPIEKPESEEKAVTKEKEQTKSDGEEKTVAGEKEQTKSDGEEKTVAGEKEQTKSDGEEKTVAEKKEQTKPNGEEKTVVEKKEQTKSDGEEKIEPTGNFPKSSRRLETSSVGAIGDIDFSPLNDSPNELDGFTQMTTNKGLEFPTEDESGRAYYMYFGDLANDRPVKSLEEDNYTKYVDDWSRPLPSMDTSLKTAVDSKNPINAANFTMATALATAPDTKDGIVTYYYTGGRVSGMQTGSGLHIAEGASPNDTPKNQTNKMPILKLYKNEKTHELVAYAAVTTYDRRYVEGYIKIKMSSVNDSKGRLKINIKYLKIDDTYAYTNVGYSVHMDIAKRHDKSKMYSLGDNKGLYFKEGNMADGLDYMLYFFRDGYANNPAVLKAINGPQTNVFGPGYFSKLNSPGITDPGKDVMYPFTSHPGWALRWDPKLQEPYTVREDNLEMAVTDKPVEQPVPPVIKLDNDGEYKDNGYHIQGTWKDEDSENVSLYYTVDGGEPKKIGDYENPNRNTDVSWEYTIPSSEVEKGLDHDITVYVIDEEDLQSNIETIKTRPALTITEKVLGADGNEAKEIAPGETLSYEVSVDSGYIAKDTGTYGDVTITQKYDTHLEVPTDLKATDENGNEIGTATYNAAKNSIEVKLNKDTPRSAKVKVTYNVKVKEDAADGEFVVGQATASGKYSTGDEVNKTSDEVKVMVTGVLQFVSAPSVIDFGSKLTISPQDKAYHPIKLDTPLAVKDSRSLAKKPSWVMTAKLEKPLTGKKTGSKLNGLHYRYGGNDSSLSEDASVEIYKKETTDKQVFNISDTWDQERDGLYLEVKAGTAKNDAYEGTIHWILQDVPMNN
ncbi:hypothetical protein U2I54_26055, partial [Bacillus pseudomycoides]|nr:hypothetical protein [Bacillus pseudomycoides]